MSLADRGATGFPGPAPSVRLPGRLPPLRSWIGGLIVSLATIGLPAAAAGAAGFTPEQRKEIEAIVHDYLVKNPDVMLDVLQAADDKLKGESRDKAAVALDTRRQELLNDPNSPVGGNPQGDVTLVEFFDYRCPYCKQVVPALEALLGEDRQLRLVYKEFPVLGPESTLAARAALASRKQGKYDAFHRALMAVKGKIDTDAVYRAAGAVGLDVERLKRDMTGADIERILKANLDLADSLDIHGTPAFVIGSEIVPGAIGLDAMKRLIANARKK